MNVFDLRDRLVRDYAAYTRSFIKIKDPRIKERVEDGLGAGAFWPEPILQLNPTYEPGGTIDDLVADGTLHGECSKIFRIAKSQADTRGKPLILHAHQREAILKAHAGKSYVLTSGTGSGKSLTYIVPIVNHVLHRGSGKGIQAIVVYPMNALANSQDEEVSKFLAPGYEEPPVRFARYTGQEKGQVREDLRKNPPDVLLTNYMMLELLLTRHEDSELVRAAQGIRFLVFDELHTYRGRQGADVALLIRRCRQAFGGHDIICVGTSATMASGGTTAEQKDAVAQVARTMFGVPFDASQVIGETLRRATPEVDLDDPKVVQELTRAIQEEAAPPEGLEEFIRHPLSSWIETTFGVQAEPGSGDLIRQVPMRLKGPGSAAEALARLTGTDQGLCANVLRGFLLRGAGSSSRSPIFAFRLHQFFTRGDTVWATIETEAQRHLELSKKASKPGEPEKPLFPLVFCRQCGTAYYRVKIVKGDEGEILLPREDRREENDEDSTEAYLFTSESAPWPQGNGQEMLDRLPEFMKEMGAQGGERVKSDERKNVPQLVHVDPQGRVVSEGEGILGALIRKNFLFCLDPDCGVAYTKSQRSERAKLGTLGVDNRSTATTIMAVRALIELQDDDDLDRKARKLLSFTDNRQDASLQAGHFNDFAQVALLRSALYRAASAKGQHGLSHGDLSRSVFDAMALRLDEYAADPDVRGPARSATENALRRVIEYFLYRDLQRGWRVTAPNLEDCGLLISDYKGLTGPDGLLAEDELWERGFTARTTRDAQEFTETPLALRRCPSELREELLRTLLDVLRRQLAIKVDVLDPNHQQDLIDQTKSRLLEDTVWYLEDTRDLQRAEVAYPRSRQRGDRYGYFVSSYGLYGRYLRRSLLPWVPKDQVFGRQEVDQALRFLFKALKRYGILEQVREAEVPGYQINADALRWLPGTGEERPVDKTRLLAVGETPPEVNAYFVECYRNFVKMKCLLEAREHTAQVASEDREEREARFREGNLPLLFCSPTMELGVDIAQLNLVNLRNVPPTPANYAQRSGRAGRGGQPALVYTYCAGRSPHDQYYYRQPNQMVSGVVAPPRIDIRNRDLLRSHLHAIWMGVVKPDLGTTMTTVIDLTETETGRFPLALKEGMLRLLRDTKHRSIALTKAQDFIASIKGDLEAAPWFDEDWPQEVLAQVERSFEQACERWRTLYRAAMRQREMHHRIILDHARPEAERGHSKRLRAQAEAQINLLTQAQGAFEGDFYSYRYLAAEGFLPGYNFPRLPLSAFVPGRRRRGHDEFVSRPRFLAISEFGPQALVYHEGARYKVYKVNLDFGTDDIEATHELVTETMKRCESCGYAHLEQGANLVEKCESCGAALDSRTRVDNLVHLQNVSLRMARRITCDEEERQRFGYRIVTAYRFTDVDGHPDRLDAEVRCDGQTIMRLQYGDAAVLYRVNLGWASQRGAQAPGFHLDLEKGYWAKNPRDDEDRDDPAAEGRTQRVVPFVRDTKNALVIRLEPARSTIEMIGLQAALREAIQKHFQLEPRELSCEPMPSSRDRREILTYEASEGGAGVLRQIVDDPAVLPQLARQALEICHFDPDNLKDKGGDSCGKACYECLLDYSNQPYHRELDRLAIRDLLACLARSECKVAGGMGSREARLEALRKQCDSQLEKKWLDMIDRYNLLPPSDAQYLIESCATKPDFYCRDKGTAIYIDGPPHDEPDQMAKDERITQRLTEQGYAVIRFHHKDDWEEIFRSHPDIFGVIP